MTHLDAEALSAAIDDEGSAEEAAHLAECAQCGAAADRFRTVARAGAVPPPPRAGADVDAAVAAALAAWVPGSTSDTGAAGHTSRSNLASDPWEGGPPRPLRSARRRARPAAAALAAAAVLIVAVAAVVGLAHRQPSASKSSSAAGVATSGAASSASPAGPNAASAAPPAGLGRIDTTAQLAAAVLSRLRTTPPSSAIPTGSLPPPGTSGSPPTSSGSALGAASTASPPATSAASASGAGSTASSSAGACQSAALAAAGTAVGPGLAVAGPAVLVAPLTWRGAPAQALVVATGGPLGAPGTVVVVVDPATCRTLATTRL